MFSNRTLLIVTKHRKEQVLAPLFEKALGVKCIVADKYDTDALGTFSGETERKDDAYTTARKKCHEAMDLYGCDLAIASEGSFGPHPAIFMAPADDELVLFIDRKNGLEIYARELSLNTNFNASEINNREELDAFLNRVKFPSHGVIVKKEQHNTEGMVKGITSPDLLYPLFDGLLGQNGSVFLETDMRAMHNPTRMEVIATAARKLAAKISSLCPQCSTPGFDITAAEPGLPCGQCRYPTASVLRYVYSCSKCSYTKEELYPHNKKYEDPMYCDMCNP
ncbi:DUF6671 family protein [Flavobacterium coralii]|uniref:DUF6671 family protein n=1 Tax=Flavobacterium coralii TaxID=2838017 RepID=UPI000C39A278|nr:hypothetical protein [Flavobacterium sp.]|tara:strand:- start:3964 stop:4800 length:837 start_codon:yes stop_codon:yes gene_type:complete